MTYDRVTGKLRAGTHGRSMWDWQPALGLNVAVPDGNGVPGEPMRIHKISDTEMQVTWDSGACTAKRYNLFHGDLANVASGTYDGAICDIGNAGWVNTTIPTSSSGNLFFLLASDDGAGTEGPHAHFDDGSPRAANGIGFCGNTAQDALATCP